MRMLMVRTVYVIMDTVMVIIVAIGDYVVDCDGDVYGNGVLWR